MPGEVGAVQGRLFALRRCAGLAAAGALCALGLWAGCAAALAQTEGATPWILRSFEQNLVECRSEHPPDWCPEWQALLDQYRTVPPPPVNTENPDFGLPSGSDQPPLPRRRPPPPPPLSEEAWQAVLQRLGQRQPRPQDLGAVRAMAEFGSADALEILGWMYAEGILVERDAARAYEYYGRALLAGAERVRPNLDLLWTRLSRTDQERLRTLFQNAQPTAPPAAAAGPPATEGTPPAAASPAPGTPGAASPAAPGSAPAAPAARPGAPRPLVPGSSG